MPPKKEMGKLREGERGEGAVDDLMEGEILDLKRGGNVVAARGRRSRRQKERKKEGKKGGKEEEGFGQVAGGLGSCRRKRKEKKKGRERPVGRTRPKEGKEK